MNGLHSSRSTGEATVIDQADSVTAVIVTFNSEKVIAQALQALRRCKNICRTIVVDNASLDGTTKRVSEEFPEVELIANSTNIGSGAANNLGLARVTTDFGFVLNPDAIVSPEAVTTLMEDAKKHSNAAILGPILQEPGKHRQIIRTGSVWVPQKIRIPTKANLAVEYLVGAAMFMRMSLVRQSGFFDPKIFLFHEDDNICNSAKRAGFSLILTTRAVVSHLVGHSTPPDPATVAFKQSHFIWSRLYLEQKNLGSQAAKKLAQRTLRKLSRKRLLARLIRDSSKLQLLRARTYAVQCFLTNQTPSTTPKDYLF